jgi:hypothetical protein
MMLILLLLEPQEVQPHVKDCTDVYVYPSRRSAHAMLSTGYVLKDGA